MPNDEGNERDEGRNHEEWQARDPRCLPGMRHQDVQNWQELRASVIFKLKSRKEYSGSFFVWLNKIGFC
jgi:hypothetical protein